MASSGSSYLKDIDEKFCQCPICLQQYKEPKLLQCLHRYCSDCLQQYIEKDPEATMVTCPECREEFIIPREGVDGFRTDFHMKSITEYIQLQKSLEGERSHECYGCSRKLKVTSFCFQCNGFLCKECNDFHMKNKSLKDHKQKVLSLEDLKSNQMTLGKLTDLRETPRCPNHHDLRLLCCRTCNYLPICAVCAHGRHKKHDINDIALTATEEREKLQNELKNLTQYKEHMLKISQNVDRVKEDITCNLREKKENFTRRYERDMQTVRNEIERLEKDYHRSQRETKETENRELTETRKQMDEDIRQIKIKYDNIFEEIKERSRVKLGNLGKKQHEEVEKSTEKLAILERELETFMNKFEKRQKEGVVKLQTISEKIIYILKRYENLTATGYSALETRNNWTAVQCIPDICKAIEPLSEDMKRKFPELETISKTWITPEIMEDDESPVNIEGIKTYDWKITDIAAGGNEGSVFFTGRTTVVHQSHITVINMKGKLLHQVKLKGKSSWLNRYCALLSKFKVATVSDYNEIGVFDVCNYSYTKRNITDIILTWTVHRNVLCVATDPLNNHILVGEVSRHVYVFDDQLNYHHTLTLPEMIIYPHHMTVSECNLLVCDYEGNKTYLVNMEEPESKLIRELPTPDFDGHSGNPMNVCTDSNGFIYVLWMKSTHFTDGKHVITQYTKDGCQLLATIPIGTNDARCITTIMIGMTEKLLVSTFESGKLYIYNLM